MGARAASRCSGTAPASGERGTHLLLWGQRSGQPLRVGTERPPEPAAAGAHLPRGSAPPRSCRLCPHQPGSPRALRGDQGCRWRGHGQPQQPGAVNGASAQCGTRLSLPWRKRGWGTARAVRPGQHPRAVPSYPPRREAELQRLSSAPRGPSSPCLCWLRVPGCGQHLCALRWVKPGAFMQFGCAFAPAHLGQVRGCAGRAVGLYVPVRPRWPRLTGWGWLAGLRTQSIHWGGGDARPRAARGTPGCTHQHRGFGLHPQVC